jgi:hypothetical protein
MTEQTGQSVYTFRQLHRACVSKGLHLRLHQFDGGHTLYVYDGATLLARETEEHGDTIHATDKVAKWLMEHGWLTVIEIADASANA